MVIADDEAHVRQRVDEAGRIADVLVLHQVGEELARDLELLVDADGLGRVDGAVRAGGGVVQFAQGRVAGSCVVPGGGGLEAGLVQVLEKANAPPRLQLLDQGSERCAHDTGADENDVE